MTSFPKTLISRTRQQLKEWKYAPVEKAIRGLAPRGRQAAWMRAYHQRRRSPGQQAQLQAILAAHPQPRAVLVFAPSLDWERQLFQRPQQLALALAKRGALVFYTQLHPAEDGSAIKALQERLYLCALPLEQFDRLEDCFVYTLTWNRKYLLKFSQPRVIYDYLDEISTFSGDTLQLARDHAALLRSADVVIATARRLLEDAQTTRPDALLVPNGVDYAHFHAGAGSPVPADMEGLCRAGKPIIGFYGAFASWFDYPLMNELAGLRPDLNFVLIGPAHGAHLEESGLARHSNVTYLGPKPYAELPAYLARFEVALLPFQVNAITQSTSPIKLFEYFAGGKPVVSTPLREVLQYPQVRTGSSAAEFNQQIDAALAARGEAGLTQALETLARQNTWEMHAERILQAMEQFNKNR